MSIVQYQLINDLYAMTWEYFLNTFYLFILLCQRCWFPTELQAVIICFSLYTIILPPSFFSKLSIVLKTKLSRITNPQILIFTSIVMTSWKRTRHNVNIAWRWNVNQKISEISKLSFKACKNVTAWVGMTAHREICKRLGFHQWYIQKA